MSYDLYFTKPKVSRTEFDRYFQGRPHYNINGSQAFYENEETGVYFRFDYYEPSVEDEGIPDHSVAFNLNFFRPAHFVLEAELELSAFVSHFQCEIEDPQGDMDGAYSPADFKRGWERGNRFGYKVALAPENRHERIFSRPEKELAAIWEWNYHKEARIAATTEDIFIPRIMFAIFDGELASFCVWPDAISTLLPKVDRIWISRSELMPGPFVEPREDDECLIPFATALPILQPYRVGGYSVDAYKLPSPVTPWEIAEFVHKLPATKVNMASIRRDQILTRELVEEAGG